MRAEQSGPSLRIPRIELSTGRRMCHHPTFGMHNQRVTADVLAHDRQLSERPSRVQTVGGEVQEREAALPDGGRLSTDLVPDPGLYQDARPERGREVHILASRVGVEVFE